MANKAFLVSRFLPWAPALGRLCIANALKFQQQCFRTGVVAKRFPKEVCSVLIVIAAVISTSSKRVCAQNHSGKSHPGMQSSLEEGWFQPKNVKKELYRFFCFSKRHSIPEQNTLYLLYYTSSGYIIFIATFTCNYLKIYTGFQRTVQFWSHYKR